MHREYNYRVNECQRNREYNYRVNECQPMHREITESMNANVCIESTITESMNANLCIESTITESMNANVREYNYRVLVNTEESMNANLCIESTICQPMHREFINECQPNNYTVMNAKVWQLQRVPT